jgi:hypothetical protein
MEECTLIYLTHPLPAVIAALDFSRIRQKLLDPVEGCGLNPDQLDLAELEYRKFLALHLAHPTVPLVPNRLVDVMWHAHILDTQRYATDCQRLFGHLLHHDPYVGIDGPASQQELAALFAETRSYYEMHFGPYPTAALEAVRCKGHACHVPTPCACRVPGACTSKTAA